MVLFGGVPALLLALVGGWFLMRRALAPVTRLTRAAEQIHLGNLQQRLPQSGNGDELDRLTQVFNEMTERLDDGLARIREFNLHASHELKTPLTVMQGEIETALRQTSIAPAERERLEGLLDEIQRLTRIVEGLTFLAKAGSGLMRLENGDVALHELVRDAQADAEILASSSGLKIVLEGCEEVILRGDRHRLRQLLLILTDNAVKYNQPRGTVSLSLRREAEGARIVVGNTGPGIPPNLLTRVFDPFFRGDLSHSKRVDGCGLGLAIARSIVQAHQGSIEIVSQPAASTQVTVRLPLTPAPVPRF